MAKSKKTKTTQEQVIPVAGPANTTIVVEHAVNFFLEGGTGIKISFNTKEEAIETHKAAFKALNSGKVWMRDNGETMISPKTYSHSFYARVEHVQDAQ